MVHVIKDLPIYLPDILDKVDENGFRQYMAWQDDRKTLNRFVVSKFKEELCKTVPWSDVNIPEDVVEEVKKIGSLEIIIKTTPTKKTISYEGVFQKFNSFVSALQEFYKDERLRKDFRTLGKEEKELYVANETILEKLTEYKNTSLSGKEGISQQVKLASPKTLLQEIPNILNLNLERNYAAVTEYNATMWQQAQNMMREATKRTVGYTEKKTEEEAEEEEEVEEREGLIKRFKMLVLDDSLQTLGKKPETPVALMYPFETVSFKHQLEPRERTAYAQVINAFIKEPPKVIKTNSKIGDLNMIKLIGEGATETLIAKKLLTEDFIKDYSPTKEDGRIYIRIAGLKKRLEDHTKDSTKEGKMEQNFFIILPRETL